MSNIYFNFVLADNEVDDEKEAFTIGALADIRRLCIGHYGIFDCTTYKAKVIEAHLMQSCGDTKDGRTKYYIYATAEMPNNEDTRDIISKIESEKPKASISCCVHHRGKDENGVTWLSAITDFYEFSIKFDREYESDMLAKELEKQLEVAEKQMIGLQDKIQNLKAKLAEAQDEPEIPNFPVFDLYSEEFWWITNTLKVTHRRYTDGQVEDYNYFHTKEYAQEFADKCKLLAMMLHCKWYLCRGFKGDYSDSSDKWVVYYGGLDDKFIATNSIHCDYGFVPFDTMDNAQKCADWLNEHWKESGDEYNS